MEQEDYFHISNVITELKSNVQAFKSDMSDMKNSFSLIFEKISESSTRLAVVIERLNSNLEDHKTIHRRIDEEKAGREYIEAELEKIMTSHKLCQEAQRLRLEAQSTKEKKDLDSPWSKAKAKVYEYAILLIIGLLAFSLYKNLDPYLGMIYSEKLIHEQNEFKVPPLHKEDAKGVIKDIE